MMPILNKCGGQMQAITKGTGKSREELRRERELARLQVNLNVKPKIKLKDIKPVKLTSPIALQLKAKESGAAKEPQKIWQVDPSKSTKHTVTTKDGKTYTRAEWRKLYARQWRAKKIDKTGSTTCSHCDQPLTLYDIENFFLDCGPCRRREERVFSRITVGLSKAETDWLDGKAAELGGRRIVRHTYVHNLIKELMAKEQQK